MIRGYLPRNTLANWIIKLQALVQPIYNLLQDRLLASGYIHMDETSVQVLKEPGKAASTKSYMWVRKTGDPDQKVVLFDYEPTRSAAVVEKRQVYLSDGRLNIDNNPIENAIRLFTIGRKNWLFRANQNGAKASAIMYSIIETAKANGFEPYRYLKHLFEQLPLATRLEDYEQLLPWNVRF